MSRGIGTYVLLAFVVAPLVSPTAGAKDLGSMGRTYAIVERDFVEELKEKAGKVDWEKVFDKEKTSRRVREFTPNNLLTVPAARSDRVRLVDMSYTLPFDIPDEQGGILYPRGFTFNPLDYIVYPRTLIILDGGDRRQVEWFTSSPFAKDLNVTLLITNGAYYDLAKELGRPVFYANAEILGRFQVEAVPSVARQKGNLMEVTEVDVVSVRKKSS